MATIAERLAILITSDGKGALREFQALGKSAEKDLGGSTARADQLSKSLIKIGVAATATSAIAAVGLYKLGQSASNLNEQLNRTRVVFGGASAGVEQFAKTAADSTGLSTTAALQATGAFGTLFSSIGKSQPVAASMSVTFAKLAGDLASFGNTSVADAVDALQSGLAGQVRPLRAYNVLLDDATLKQRAMAMGLTQTTTGVLPPAIRVQAAYAEVLAQTKLQQGDFVRTSAGFANQQRILSANFENLKSSIGAGVLPIMVDLVGALDKGVTAFNGLDDSTKAAIGKFAAIATGGAALLGTLSLATGALIKMRGAFITTTVAAEGAEAAIGLSALGIGAVVVAAAAGAVGLVALGGAFDKASIKAGDLAQLTDSQLMDAFTKLNKVDLGGSILDSLTKQGPAGKAQLGRLADALTATGKDATDVRNRLTAMSAAEDKASKAAGALGSDVGDAGDSASAAAGQFIDLGNAISAAFSAGTGAERAALGVADANQAVADAQKEVGASGVKAAGGTSAAGKSALDAERSTRDYEAALRGVDDAQRAVEDSTRGVSDAQRGVQDAERASADAAQNLTDAQQGVVIAERAVEDAHRGVDDAARGVEASQRKVADSALALENAQRGVATAQRKVEDSSLALEAAQRKVGEAQLKAGDATTKLADEQLKLQQITGGFGAGSAEGATAQEKAASAQRDQRRASLAVTDAQKRLTDAQKKAVVAQSNYGDGSLELADATRDVERAQIDLEQAQADSVSSTEDAQKAQQDLNTTVNGFGPASREAADQTRAVADAQREAEAATRGVGDASRDAVDAQVSLDEATRGVGKASDEVKDRQRDLEDANRGVEGASRNLEGAYRDVILAEHGVRDATREVSDRQRDLVDSHRGVEDATRNVEQANRDLEAAIRGVDDANFHVLESEQARVDAMTGGSGGGGGSHAAVKTQTERENDLAKALLDQKDAYQEAADKAGEKAVKDAEAAAALTGTVIPAQDLMTIRVDATRTKLEELISTLAPGSPLRQYLQGYRDQLDQVPGAHTTTFTINASAAADQIRGYADFIQGFNFFGTALPGADALIHTINRAADRLSAQATGDSYVPGLAAGGPAMADHLYRVGESGPETFRQGGKLYLIPDETGRVAPTSVAGPGGGVQIGQIVVPSGGPREMAHELSWLMRTRGRAA